MQTSHTINLAIDSESYWERIALYLMWRDIPVMFCSDSAEEYTFYDINESDYNIHYMLNLSVGFYRAMDSFIRKVRYVLTMDYELRETEENDWPNHISSPLPRLVLLAEQWRMDAYPTDLAPHVKGQSLGIENMSMKEVVKREVQWIREQPKLGWEREIQKAVNKIDDLPIPPNHKKQLMKIVCDTLVSIDDCCDVGCQLDKFH